VRQAVLQNDIVAPHLVLVETTNILRRLARSRELSPLEAAIAQRDLMRLAIDLLPFEPFAERVWELRRNVTSHDAWYVAIAEAFDLPLATLDRRRRIPPQFSSIRAAEPPGTLRPG
jgi:predicted nucleic acid-binding protein